MLAVFEIALAPTAVAAPIVTGTVMTLPLLAAAIAVEDVQLKLLAPIAPVQVQAVPLGTALRVNPMGNVSVTVIVAVVAPVPLLLGVIVYCAPLWPMVHGPLLVFVIATVGTPLIVVVLAVLEAAVPVLVCTRSPPP
jgi:hypothetical protein